MDYLGGQLGLLGVKIGQLLVIIWGHKGLVIIMVLEGSLWGIVRRSIGGHFVDKYLDPELIRERDL